LQILPSKTGAGDEDRTRNFQLGKLNFRFFIFNTYKVAAGIFVHALHTVNAGPDLRVVGGPLRDGATVKLNRRHSYQDMPFLNDAAGGD
jgi:hypothetical protein